MQGTVAALLVLVLMCAAAVSLAPAQAPDDLDLVKGAIKYKPGKNGGLSKLAYKVAFGVEGLGDFDPEIHSAVVTISGGPSNFVANLPPAYPGWKGKAGKWSAKTPEGFKIKIDAAKGLVTFAAKALGGEQPANPISVIAILGEINALDEGAWTESASKPGNFKFP